MKLKRYCLASAVLAVLVIPLVYVLKTENGEQSDPAPEPARECRSGGNLASTPAQVSPGSHLETDAAGPDVDPPAETDDTTAGADDNAEKRKQAEEMRRELPPWELPRNEWARVWETAHSGAIAEPESVAEPSTALSNEQANLSSRTVPSVRHSGLPPGARVRFPRREVWGRVLEVRGAELVPLSGAIVYDYDDVRTFSDEQGRFRFEAYCSEDGSDSETLDNDPSNDKCHLTAWASGYVAAFRQPTWFDAQVLNSDEGVQLYLRKVDNAPIRLRLTNPPADPGEITLWAGGFGTGARSFQYDENYFVQGKADENGELLISVPPLTFGTFGAQGPGWRSPQSSWNDLGWYDGVRTIEIPLKPADNKLVRGVVYDMRNGAVLPGVKVCTYNDQGEVTFTDDRGTFELWVDSVTEVNESGNALEFSHPGYRGISWRLDYFDPPPGDIAGVDRPGGTYEGVWTVSLRPLVRVEGRIMETDGSPLSGGDVTPVGDAWPQVVPIGRGPVEVGVDGSFSTNWFPWGVRSVNYVNMATRVSGSAAIDEGVWGGSGPYQLDVVFR